jgi:hypothetical protein
LVSADDGIWGDHNPARDCYSRFGWRKDMPARHIAGWWQWSIKEYQRESESGSLSKNVTRCIEAYTKAFTELMAVL